MSFVPDSMTADINADDAGLTAMRAALRDLKAVMRKSPTPAEHPRRTEMLAILADTKTRIDRING